MPNYSCKVEQGKNKPPHIVWETDNGEAGYKLIEIAQANGFMNDLPGTERIYKFDKLLENKNNLVFSEPSSGRMDFIESYKKFLDDKKYHWLFVKADTWDKAAFDHSDSFENGITNGTSEVLDELLTIVDNLGDKKISLGDKINAIKTWLKAHKELEIALIFRDISKLEIKLTSEIVAILRQIFDDYPDVKLSVLILDTCSLAFLDAAEASGYAPLCYQYRLPFLCRIEIEKLLFESFKETSLQIEDGVLERIHEQTGGQLLLVQDCLRRILLDDNNTLTLKIINKAIKNMHNNPPGVVKKWQEELKAILQRNPELIISMRAYVGGNSLSKKRFPPPSQELNLFLAGWLNVSHLGRWGISSALHASLATPILNSVRQGD